MFGYAGKILRIDLDRRTTVIENLAEEFAEKYIGGTGFGAAILYDEVPPGTSWDAGTNRLTMANGPFSGTTIAGSGLISVVTKSPMTGCAVATQANGFFGAYLKLSGFDAIVFQGKARKLSCLHVNNGKGEILEVPHLSGKDTAETESLLRAQLGYGSHNASICSIGPAGEHMVRFACIMFDNGHAASKGGAGAVLGSKNVKAVVAARGIKRVSLYDEKRVMSLGRHMLEKARNFEGGSLSRWGTAGGYSNQVLQGTAPVKNYTTNLFPDHERLGGQYMRQHFEHRPKPCWACPINHVIWLKVTEGRYKGLEWEEPEYECIAAFAGQIGNTDAGAVVFLTSLCDRLGLDVNETGWLLGWVMECYEKGVLQKEDLGNLEMRWGDVETCATLLQKISKREGIGDHLAEGVKRASEKAGKAAADTGIYTMTGVTPRGHDHRARWVEMLDTCLSNTSTIQDSAAGLRTRIIDIPELKSQFSYEEIPELMAKFSGWHQFEDSICVCRFCSRGDRNAFVVIDDLNAITGWRMTLDDALTAGRRIVNTLMGFNLRHGHDPKLEKPSPRYGSTPVDGPAAGLSVMPHWAGMVSKYRTLMDWDPETGVPLPQTLHKLGLGKMARDLHRSE